MTAHISPPVPLALSIEALSALMPMHVVVGQTGHIQSVGPTLASLNKGSPFLGRRLLEIFEIRRPTPPDNMKDLLKLSGRQLVLQFRAGPRTVFRGIVVPMSDGSGAFLNLSFGIGVIEAVAKHQLTAGDFAPTDLTVEMLYLVEAKSAAMEESRRLNRRLEGARLAAQEQALTDVLTGLRNRRALEDALDRLIELETPFGMIHMDLDRFKIVNDTLGHAAGDAVLAEVAKILQEELREEDLAARVGGDEFVLIIPNVLNTNKLETIAQRIIRRIEEPVPFEDDICQISASAGIVISSYYDRVEAERMLQDADAALYASKHAGRAQATVYRPEAILPG